jgi:hypothetical protein
MAAGRPTSYSDALINEIPKYLSTVGREQTTLPTRYGFARYINVNDDTLVEWEKSYPQFSAAIKKVDQAQKEQLMNDGMYGGKEVNPGMAIFLLKANHGLIETQRTELTGANGEPFQLNVIAAAGYNHLSRPLPLDAASAGSVIRGQSPVQSLGVPPAGPENNHRDHRDNQAGTS